MKAILYQLDGKIPNIALMRIAAHHRDRGDEVELRWQGHGRRELWDRGDETVYASIIFERSRPRAEELLRYWPQAIVGGTGWELTSSRLKLSASLSRLSSADRGLYRANSLTAARLARPAFPSTPPLLRPLGLESNQHFRVFSAALKPPKLPSGTEWPASTTGREKHAGYVDR